MAPDRLCQQRIRRTSRAGFPLKRGFQTVIVSGRAAPRQDVRAPSFATSEQDATRLDVLYPVISSNPHDRLLHKSLLLNEPSQQLVDFVKLKNGRKMVGCRTPAITAWPYSCRPWMTTDLRRAGVAQW